MERKAMKVFTVGLRFSAHWPVAVIAKTVKPPKAVEKTPRKNMPHGCVEVRIIAVSAENSATAPAG